VKARSRLSRETLEGSSPREHPAVGVLNTRLAARDSRKGQSPETAARQAGPRAFGREGIRAGGTVCGFGRFGNEPDTFREEKAPKGKSQERCRCETKPARVTKGVSRREGSQTLRAERSGQAKARESVDLRALMC